jgi:hypothetical protein
MTGHATLALAPSFAKGVAVYVSAIILFIGSVYVLVAAVFGPRMGYLIIATAWFGWMIILSALWTFGAPGTLRNLGPQGTAPHWQVVAATNGPAHTRFPQTETFPGRAWNQPATNSVAASSVPAVISSFQMYLAQQAQAQLAKEGKPGTTIDATLFTVQDVAFATSGKTPLAAGHAFFASGGPEITVYAYHDSGDVQLYSYGFLLASILGFALHVPFLDRAEKSRKEILTGGTTPPWYGPA